MVFSTSYSDSIGPLPCGFMSCAAAVGLLAGTSRDEKQAMRRAERAARAFRAQRGYRSETLLSRAIHKLRVLL